MPSVAGWCGAQAGDQPQHRRLAAARRPEDRDELALARQVRHREGDVANHGEVAEPLRDARETRRCSGSGVGHSSSLATRYGKQAALEEEQQPVDAEGEQPDDHEDQDDVLRQAAPLAGHQQVAEPVARR